MAHTTLLEISCTGSFIVSVAELAALISDLERFSHDVVCDRL